MYIFSLTAAVNKTGLEKNFFFKKKKKKGGEMQTFADMKRTKVKTKEK